MKGTERGEFLMPSLGADMESGTVAEWLVKPGDQIRRGDAIAVIDTDKAMIEAESFHTGTVESLLVETGHRVPVGTPLAVIAAVPPHAAGPRARVASPLARTLAARLGVDLSAVHGTGRAGTIRAEDVREAAERETTTRETAARGVEPRPRERPRRTAPGPAEARPQPDHDWERRQETMRQAIARAMARSKREIPHYYLSTTVDMSAALSWLRERNRDLPVSGRLLPAAVLLKAAARAATEVPRLNGFWVDDAFVPGEAVHLGVAVSLKDGGLIAPALHDAACRELDDLMAALKDLVSRARTGRLRSAEMTEATITVTNLGDQGVESVHGVIYPPQVALVGFGKILDRPWAVDGLLGVRPVVTVTLAADHRATDGYTGARFLCTVDRLLNHPETL
ncbi:2-oxo acid dehydrogenase subunit E2 [Microbispora sp. RL4-1S]|uniref:Dihydrolipoamide acetyltransferase component of pyruvate dehydrogenase complex n=1 Tax=Microbispora oryzae TaxID=2806554 RepID=A0A940WQH4_9ACTN|nr:dihydrolipoamide acetyltransferase family protein [Microbispora oryzae]MBP2705084.1 2-oxo acid dehydrogenase subunit E2 [Microbispora oryzae]